MLSEKYYFLIFRNKISPKQKELISGCHSKILKFTSFEKISLNLRKKSAFFAQKSVILSNYKKDLHHCFHLFSGQKPVL